MNGGGGDEASVRNRRPAAALAEGAAEASSVESASARSRREVVERLSAKLHAAVWVVLAGLVWHYGRVWERLAAGDRIGPGGFVGFTPWLMVSGALLLGVSTAVAMYLVVWLRWVRQVDLAWEVVAPSAIPVATGAGLAALVCFLVGMWPAYSLLTPLLLGILTLGALMLAHFVPSP